MKLSARTILAVSCIVTGLSTSAFAGSDQLGSWNDPSSQQGGIGSQIINGQINLQNNWSNMNGSVDTVGGNFVAQGSAGGNKIDIMTMNNTSVLNGQYVGPNANIGSNMNLDVNNIWGSVGISNQVMCNSASVSTDPVLTSIHSNQECHAADPFSAINTNISNVAGNAVVQGSSLGNTFQADSNAPNMPIMSRQLNNSAVVSNVNANTFNVAGSVGMSSSAIGNTSQVIHYNTN